ncbi:MAG: hypothetical protein JO257_38085 [Deltaproteobacteria bacterium]|nr:hypothetical protein [Deltaproteobacteria bacterium]
MADPQTVVEASTLQMVGAGCFGGLIGWLLYSFNRQRKEQPTLGDIVTILGAIAGTAVLALFPARTDLFGAYGIGLAIGFVLYFLTLVIMVSVSKNFTIDWFLDGRRKKPADGFYVPTRDEQAAAVNAPMGNPGKQQPPQG